LSTILIFSSSNIRQVPDNQEVYLDNSGFSSIVVELLERVDKPENEALEYHLRDLVEDDEDDAAQKTKVWWSGDAVGAKLP
jgi:RNA:NAD 2'-phosphotransferase (TPT1/KptA family)